MSKKVLGRGLGAFFPEYSEEGEESGKKPVTAVPIDPAVKANTVLEIPVDHIRANPNQPRQEFNTERLEELAESIRLHDLIQPITVRYLGEKRFELISGERRLRASKLAGKSTVPAYIREVDDEQSLTLALIENIQREDLNPLEVALGYRRLMEEMGYTQAEVADRVGKNRTTVTNMLRLLNLPDFIQAALRDEQITSGHARALINLKDEKLQKRLLDTIIEEELSVRQVEEAVRELAGRGERSKKPAAAAAGGSDDPFLQDISRRLRRALSTRVDVKGKSGGGGEIRIAYYTDDDLERILQFFEQDG